MDSSNDSRPSEYSEEVERLCKKGETLLSGGDLEAAKEKFKAAAEKGPSSARAVAGLGRVLCRQCVTLMKQLEQDMLDERTAGSGGARTSTFGVRLSYAGKPTHAVNLPPMAFAGFQELLRSAVEKLEEAISLGAQSADCHADLGELYVRVRDREQAFPHLEEALELDPNHYHAHYWLGMLFRGMECFAEAIPHFSRAAALSPQSGEAHYELGSAYYRHGQVAESIPCLQKAVELNPRNADALCNLGTSLSGVGRQTEALDVFRHFIALDPESYEARRLIAAFPSLAGKGGRWG